jgi:CelD/BcsL family acetyltransferase involved in cellulose biosynthesis
MVRKATPATTKKSSCLRFSALTIEINAYVTSLSIDVVQGTVPLQAIAAEWDAIVPPTFTAALSQSGWYFACQDAFPAKELVAVTARMGGRLIGVLPLLLMRTDARGLFFSQVTTFSRGDYQPPILGIDALPDVLPAMVDAAIGHFGRRIVYWWAKLPITEPSLEVLRSHLGRLGMSITEQVEVAPRLHIAGRSYAEIEATWSPSHRTDVRRQRKRLAGVNPISLWEPQSLDEAHSLLDELFTVHDEKWLSQGLPGRFQNSTERKHFGAIVQRLWGRGLHMSALRCGSINVSFGFGFFAAGWVQWYRPTYRTEFHNMSPGKVHIALLLEEACRRKWSGIDFLLGAEGYKLQWSNEQLRVIDLYASFSKWAPAYQWFTRGKPYVRDRLGPMYARFKARLQNGLSSKPVAGKR